MSSAPKVSKSRLRPAILAGVVAVGVLAPAMAAPPASAAPIGCSLPIPIGDCEAPNTQITMHPDAETTARAAGFEFGITNIEILGVTFECKLEGPGQSGAWEDCTDPSILLPAYTGSISYTGLDVGSYVFSVRGTDINTNTENPPKQFAWEVVPTDPGTPPDDQAPNTTITSGAARWHLAPYIGIDYKGNEPLIDAHCTLNGAARDCNSRTAIFYGMTPRDYTFTVAGVDENGNVDPTPATDQWTVPYQAKTMSLSKGWAKKSGNGYFQDNYVTTSKKGATAKLGHKSYRSAALVATRGPGYGKVQVSLGKQVLKTVNLAASKTRKRQAIPLGSWSKARTGVITVKVLTSGRKVVIEGLGFSARR